MMYLSIYSTNLAIGWHRSSSQSFDVATHEVYIRNLQLTNDTKCDVYSWPGLCNLDLL